MAAATTWVTMSSTFVPTAASAITSGTKDSTVRTTVVRIQAVRGWPAKRRSAVAMTSPRTAKISVMTANPAAGIGAPESSVLMPTAWPAAATAAGAAAAATGGAGGRGGGGGVGGGGHGDLRWVWGPARCRSLIHTTNGLDAVRHPRRD